MTRGRGMRLFVPKSRTALTADWRFSLALDVPQRRALSVRKYEREGVHSSFGTSLHPHSNREYVTVVMNDADLRTARAAKDSWHPVELPSNDPRRNRPTRPYR